jgi:L-ribulose-5-phosphate 3-epimerase
MQTDKRMMTNRRTAIATWAALSIALLTSSLGFTAEKPGFRIGTCDWSIRMQLSEKSFQFAQRNGLNGIQYSFDAVGNGLDLRLRENRDAIRKTVKETGVAISSLGIGLLNKVPLATTEEADKLVVECIETMVKLKEEAAALKDRDLAAKVSPDIVLLAFFGKADINGNPDRIKTVIEKLKRLAPLAEKHGFTLGLETLLNEADHRHILNSVGSSAVKVYYDTANSARMGYDIYREIKSLGTENICEIHIKENGTFLGKGPIDFNKVKSLLVAMDYQGWLIIEGSIPKKTNREDATAKNAVYTRSLFNP